METGKPGRCLRNITIYPCEDFSLRWSASSPVPATTCWINRVAPTAMIFCPCVDGLSHNEDETITPEWPTAGTDVLLHAVLETAGIVG